MEGVVFHFFPYNVGNASSLPFRLQCNVPLWVACQLLHVIKSNIKHTEIWLLQSVPCGPGPALSSGASECSTSKRRRGGTEADSPCFHAFGLLPSLSMCVKKGLWEKVGFDPGEAAIVL